MVVCEIKALVRQLPCTAVAPVAYTANWYLTQTHYICMDSFVCQHSWVCSPLFPIPLSPPPFGASVKSVRCGEFWLCPWIQFAREAIQNHVRFALHQVSPNSHSPRPAVNLPFDGGVICVKERHAGAYWLIQRRLCCGRRLVAHWSLYIPAAQGENSEETHPT